MIKYRLGIWFLVLSLFALAGPCFAAATAATPTKPAATTAPSGTTPLPTPIGRVVWAKGVFTAVAANEEVRTLQKKSIIYLHDVLKTDEKSQAEIVFTDNSLMTFKEGTTFAVDKYSDKNHGNGGSFISTLTTGGFRTITGLVAKNNPSKYQVNTPVGTIGVRGTDFQTALHNGKLFVAVFKGTPCIRNQPKDKTKPSNELCLDKAHPFGVIVDPNLPPQFLNAMPPELGSQLQITQTTMLPFQANTSPSGGPITSFCISE